MSIYAASVSQKVVDDFTGRIQDPAIGLTGAQVDAVVRAFIESIIICGNGIDIHHPDKISSEVAKSPK